MITDELYPNSPLREVVFEIRFPGEPAIECHRDQLFDRVRGEFPNVLVPKLQPGQAVALVPYHFQSEDGLRSFMTALNLCAYRTSAYVGFSAFKGEVLKWMGLFRELFPIDRMNRTGLRYINAIPYGLTKVPLKRLFRFGLQLGDVVPEEFSRFLLITEIPGRVGSITLQMGVAEEQGEDVLVLDFDFETTGELHFSDLEQYLEVSHAETKRLFEGLLTDEYRTYLRGETLK
jgi:uncharacterized protein (TIGR04255 family)